MIREPILEIQDLSVSFFTEDGRISAIRDLSMSIGHGEILAVCGESGCGKSVLCKAIMGLLPRLAEIRSGTIRICGREVTGLSDREFCQLRGADVSMVFQDPFVSLDPSCSIGEQIEEAIRIHEPAVSSDEARERGIGLMEAVGIDRASERYDTYPWMLSGGMRQRCVLAMALSQDPKLLIADEPTTALDVTVQTEILDLLLKLRRERDLSVLFISHDLGVISRVADRVSIMYAGRIIETGTAEEVLTRPAHPYTRGLLGALPAFAKKGRLNPVPGTPPVIVEGFRADAFAERNKYALGIDYVEAPPFFELTKTHRAATWLLDPRAPKIPSDSPDSLRGAESAGSTGWTDAPEDSGRPVLLSVKDLSHGFRIGRRSVVKALDRVSFHIRQGEIYSLVGESGSGKSTLAKCVLGMLPPAEGHIRYDGVDITASGLSRHDRKRLSREIQFISQDPGAALDPRMTVRDIIAEPLIIHRMFSGRRQLDDYVRSMLREVQLDEHLMDRTPAQLSGGQKQRVSIARAYGMDPKLLVADEPLASLDVSIQAQMVELFLSLRKRHDTAVLFISHDLSMVRLISDRIGVMYRGRLVEQAPAEELFRQPAHPYTKSLLSAIPLPDPKREKMRKMIRYEQSAPAADLTGSAPAADQTGSGRGSGKEMTR